MNLIRIALGAALTAALATTALAQQQYPHDPRTNAPAYTQTMPSPFAEGPRVGVVVAPSYPDEAGIRERDDMTGLAPRVWSDPYANVPGNN
jgi:hypothetical protein